jgi:hypothetical protein
MVRGRPAIRLPPGRLRSRLSLGVVTGSLADATLGLPIGDSLHLLMGRVGGIPSKMPPTR